MVLGVDWLQTLDELTLSFRNLSVKLSEGGRTWEFKGIQAGVMEFVSASVIDNPLFQNDKGWGLLVCNKEEPINLVADIHPELEAACREFESVFNEVQGLPPPRTHDHQIPLARGAEPVNLRPYRHSWEQKNAIEKMIGERLDACIIRDNRSSYASLIVLVKGDGTW